MLKHKSVVFLGAGSMAEAMIAGIVSANKVPSKQIIVSNNSNRTRLIELENKYGIRGVPREQLRLNEIDVLILAMKPKDAEKALLSIKDEITQGQVVLSVLAGISTSFMEQNLKPGQQVIRVMPNTSSMIGESATAISKGKFTKDEQVVLAKELLEAIGEVYVIEEDKMDIFTGIAGSGPAYFYYLMEHIEIAGKDAGLDEETSRKIASQTILGAAKMMMENDSTPADLREKVTSPNGTTAAGLEALAKHGGGKAIKQAIQHAAKRSKEISAQMKNKTIVLN